MGFKTQPCYIIIQATAWFLFFSRKKKKKAKDTFNTFSQLCVVFFF